MKRNKFSEAQIVKILEAFENGKNVDDICREYNVGRSTIYLLRNKYGEWTVHS
jgi:putative transposase